MAVVPAEPGSALSQAAGPERHLSTDEVRSDVGRRSARGGVLMVASCGAQAALGLASTVVLARLLTPHDFGLLAMVAAVTGFVSTFRDLGLPAAAVQKSELRHEQVSGLFWVNLKLSLLVAAGLALAAPLVAWFYGEPRLTGMMLALTTGTLVLGLSMLHVGLLRRRMRFAALAAIEVSAAAAGAAAGIGAALLGAGYWALVLQQVAANGVQAGALWLTCGWRPASPRESSGRADPDLKGMLSYGRQTSSARVITYLGRNLDFVLVGRFLGGSALGLYQRAFQWSVLPFQQVYSPLMGVAVSAMSRLRHDVDGYRAYARKALLALFAVTFPGTAFVFVAAADITRLLLGEQWDGAIPLLRVLSVATFVGSVGLVTKWVYLAEGKTDRQLRWALISAPLIAGGVVAGLPWGAFGVAVGYTAVTSALACPSVWYCLRTSQLRARDFCGPAWRPAAASLVAASVFLAFGPVLLAHGDLWVRLGTQGGLFFLSYCGFWAASRRGRCELLALLRARQSA